MRTLIMAACAAALASCSGGNANNNAAAANETAPSANKAAPTPANHSAPRDNVAAPSNQVDGNMAVASYPSDFPSDDPSAIGADCYVLLSLSMQAGEGPDLTSAAMSSARTRWRTALRSGLGEEGMNQLTASQVNFRLDTPAPQRDAASRWCVEHAPGQAPPARR